MTARNVVPLRRRPCLIDPKAPLETAATFVRDQYMTGRPPIASLVHWQGEFFAWCGSHYMRVPRDRMRAELYMWAERQINLDGLAIKPTRRFVDDLVDALKAVTSINVPAAPSWLVENVSAIGNAGAYAGISEEERHVLRELDDYRPPLARDMIAMANGLMQLPTRRLQAHSPVLFSTAAALDFAFDPRATAPTWLTFLRQLWPDDEESIEALREWFALSLTEDASFQKILLLVGPPRSGKGTIARIWRHLVGAENMSSPTLGGLGEHFGLASLIGKRLAIVSDARLGGRADLAAIAENLLRITGEDAINVARKNLPDWTGHLGVRFVLLTNELPALLDASGALASRFVILRLERSFLGEEDQDLTSKLAAELPAVFNWALAGLDRLRERKRLTQPGSAIELVQQLKALSSPISAFLAERCIVEADAWVECGLLFDEWREWCREQNRQEGSVQMFGKHLGAAVPGVRLARPRVQGRQQRVYEGIRLRTTSDPDPI